MNSEFKIQEATLNDSKQICILNAICLDYVYPEEETIKRINYILSNTKDKIFVAKCNNNVIGYIHGSAYETTFSDSLKNIITLVVDKRYRRHGVGQRLIDAIERWAKSDLCSGVRLVSSFNRIDAHKLYSRCGYINKKNQKNFIKYFN